MLTKLETQYMDTNAQYTKQRILRRMQKLAVKLLNFKSIDQLDPVILLFIQSLAEEVYKSAREINNIESRIIDKLSDVLVTDTTDSTSAAHAILHATPLENDCLLTLETEFVCNHPKKELDKLTFHPACNTLVREGRVCYQINNGILFEIDTDFSREAVSRSREVESMYSNTCWIGLEISPAINNLENLSFYIDFPSTDNKEKYLNLLPYTLWILNDNPVNMEQGIYSVPQEFKNRYVKLFSMTNIEPSSRMNARITSYYRHHFLTISGGIFADSNKQPFPEQLKQYYPESVTDEFKRELIWFEIKFPPFFDKAVLEQMRISINAFPVLNKQLHEITTYVNELSAIVPLTTDDNETFISIHSISDSQGREYYDLPFSSTEEQEYRTYSLRKGGIERYDARDAKKSLADLANRMESRIAFYTNRTDGDDTSRGTQKQIQLLSAYLRRLVRDYTDKRSAGTYLLLDQLQDDEIIFAKYWATHNEAANNIPINTFLECPLLTELIPSTVRLLTATTGGNSYPLSASNNKIYHSSLASRILLVTSNDIVEYCLQQFKDIVKNATVRSDYMKCEPPEDGFLRTTDVYVELRELTDKSFYPKIESHIWKGLKENSPATFRYRVFANKEDNRPKK